MSREEERRGLTNIEDYVDILLKELKDYIKKSKERLIIIANGSSGNISTDRKIIKTRKQKWGEKQLYGYFKSQTDDIVYEKTGIWLRKRETEFLLIAV